MDYDFTTLAHADAYRLLSGSVVPRPIGWISSVDAAGTANLAPFSFFNVVCAAPPLVAFAPVRDEGGRRKDTLANVEATREFVVNVVDETLIAAMDATSAVLPPGESEFDATGLTRAPSATVRPPRVAESRIHFECTLVEVLHFGDGGEGSGELVIGRVLHAHVDDAVLADGRIDPARLRPVGRMGGPFYARPEILPFRRERR